MSKPLGILIACLGCLTLFLVSLIAIFDFQTAPPSNSASWHAYLTENELKHPLAKYWFDRAEPDVGVLEALNAGPLRKDEVLSWDSRQKLLEEG